MCREQQQRAAGGDERILWGQVEQASGQSGVHGRPSPPERPRQCAVAPLRHASSPLDHVASLHASGGARTLQRGHVKRVASAREGAILLKGHRSFYPSMEEPCLTLHLLNG